MPSPLAEEIRDQVRRYVAADVTLDDAKDWLVGATRDIGQRRDREAKALTYEIKGRLAEHSSGDVGEDDVRRPLRPFVAPAAATVSA